MDETESNVPDPSVRPIISNGGNINSPQRRPHSEMVTSPILGNRTSNTPAVNSPSRISVVPLETLQYCLNRSTNQVPSVPLPVSNTPNLIHQQVNVSPNNPNLSNDPNVVRFTHHTENVPSVLVQRGDNSNFTQPNVLRRLFEQIHRVENNGQNVNVYVANEMRNVLLQQLNYGTSLHVRNDAIDSENVVRTLPNNETVVFRTNEDTRVSRSAGENRDDEEGSAVRQQVISSDVPLRNFDLRESNNQVSENVHRNIPPVPNEVINRNVRNNIETNVVREQVNNVDVPGPSRTNSEVVFIDSEDSNISENMQDEEPPAKYMKMGPMIPEKDDSEGQTCSICLDVWTVSGEHRLASLKCGHLFGHSCIKRWLRQLQTSNRCCPTCKRKASNRDIRFIYAKKITITDNTEIEDLKTQLESIKTEKNRLEIELQKTLLNQQMYFNKISKLEKEILHLKQVSVEPVSKHKNWKYALHLNLEVAKDLSCRVLAFNNRSHEIYVSQLSTNALFPGYAMRKINCADWKMGKLIHLHPKLIRDATYSKENDLLLTVSLDKSVKLIQGSNNMIVSTVTCEVPLWSCCWDKELNNRFYLGGLSGIIFEYDVRQPKTFMTRLAASNDLSPVVSLAPVTGGILSCQLSSFRGHYKHGSTFQSRQFPIDGSFLCVSSDPVSNDVLVSCRPSTNHQRNRHMVCNVDLEADFDFVVKQTIESSNVQSLMARSAIYNLSEEVYIAAHSEADKAVCIWSASSGKRIQVLGASDNIVDILPVVNDYGELNHLVTLSQNRARIYKAFSNED